MLEAMQNSHGSRITTVEGKVSLLERVAYTVTGAIALVQFVPMLKAFLA
jgi:uncharacterized membrane protein YuzA (DUF378 family)